MSINYNDRKFRLKEKSENSALSESTVFHYFQEGNILTCEYAGDDILKGHLIGTVTKEGVIDMRYHQISKSGELMTGICRSVPEINQDGKIILHEEWEWTSGDRTKGRSTLVEI